MATKIKLLIVPEDIVPEYKLSDYSYEAISNIKNGLCILTPEAICAGGDDTTNQDFSTVKINLYYMISIP